MAHDPLIAPPNSIGARWPAPRSTSTPNSWICWRAFAIVCSHWTRRKHVILHASVPINRPQVRARSTGTPLDGFGRRLASVLVGLAAEGGRGAGHGAGVRQAYAWYRATCPALVLPRGASARTAAMPLAAAVALAGRTDDAELGIYNDDAPADDLDPALPKPPTVPPGVRRAPFARLTSRPVDNLLLRVGIVRPVCHACDLA